MQCMVSWLKSNPDTTVSESRGVERAKFLEAWLVMNLRQKNAPKTTATTKAEDETQMKATEFDWWSAKAGGQDNSGKP